MKQSLPVRPTVFAVAVTALLNAVAIAQPGPMAVVSPEVHRDRHEWQFTPGHAYWWTLWRVNLRDRMPKQFNDRRRPAEMRATEYQRMCELEQGL